MRLVGYGNIGLRSWHFSKVSGSDQVLPKKRLTTRLEIVTAKKFHGEGLEKHFILQSRDFDWEPNRRLLSSDVTKIKGTES